MPKFPPIGASMPISWALSGPPAPKPKQALALAEEPYSAPAPKFKPPPALQVAQVRLPSPHQRPRAFTPVAASSSGQDDRHRQLHAATLEPKSLAAPDTRLVVQSPPEVSTQVVASRDDLDSHMARELHALRTELLELRAAVNTQKRESLPPDSYQTATS